MKINFVRATLHNIDRDVFIRDIVAAGYSKSQAKQQYARLMNDVVWVSTCGTYQVNENAVNTPIGEVIHLSIKRMDKEPIRDWRVMQAIKTSLCGAEREGCELYPAESRVLDAANQYHLWVLPEGSFFPFGFFGGRAVSETSLAGSVQRPLEDSDAASQP